MTHEEIIEELVADFNSLPPAVKIEFLNTHKDELIKYHHGLGTAIRNKYKLWEIPWEPMIVDGFDISPYHPDSVSMTIIEQVWERLHA